MAGQASFHGDEKNLFLAGALTAATAVPGANVIFEVDPQLGTLLDFKFKRKFIAEPGDPGGQQNMTGHNGKDALIKVPEGTIIKAEDGTVLCDMRAAIINASFFLAAVAAEKETSFLKTDQPERLNFAQPGEPGQEQEVILELKLLADVGIIGFPNAGKSTLISKISGGPT